MRARFPHVIRCSMLALVVGLGSRTLLAQQLPGDTAFTAPPSAPGAGADSATPLPAARHRDVPEVQRYDVGGGRTLEYTRPRFLESARGVPFTLAASATDAFRVRNAVKFGGIAAGTALLIAYDQRIVNETRRFSRRIGLPATHPSIDFKAGGIKLFYVPTTISSGLYYLGDGWVTMLVAGSFYGAGTVRHDFRALRTASEITQAMFTLGIVTQVLKHSTGRQTPSEATRDGGAWHAFPSMSEYSKNVPGFDAFPSGHLATAMATVTVVALNYPEKRWVRPLGYSLMGGLSLAMVNNGVHWASDYPLALAIGGIAGKIAVNRGRTESRSASAGGDSSGTRLSSLDMTPILAPGVVGLRVMLPR